MAINRDKYARQLPDGTHVCDTLTAASEYGTTPPGFTMAAKKAGLKRYAAQGPRGQVTHYWVVDEVEALARQRFGEAVKLVEDSPFVEAPYEPKGK